MQVLLNAAKPSSIGLAEEAAQRFGKDRIVLSVHNVDFIFKHKSALENTFHELYILDEPTSGLDPVSRDELLEIFKHLKKQGVTILFSTHITSDLEKCADDITYIKDGKMIYTGSISDFVGTGASLENVMIEQEREAFYEKLTD